LVGAENRNRSDIHYFGQSRDGMSGIPVGALRGYPFAQGFGNFGAGPRDRASRVPRANSLSLLLACELIAEITAKKRNSARRTPRPVPGHRQRHDCQHMAQTAWPRAPFRGPVIEAAFSDARDGLDAPRDSRTPFCAGFPAAGNKSAEIDCAGHELLRRHAENSARRMRLGRPKIECSFGAIRT